MNKKIIFCQFSAAGNKDAVEYFRKRSEKFAYLLLSFHHVRSKRKTNLSIYKNGKKVKERELVSWRPRRQLVFLLMPLLYLIHLLNILRLNLFLNETYDLFIGQNYFCTFGGILLKWLGVTRRAIYWVGDYFPIPPSGPYRHLLKVFRVLDKFCLKFSDEVWFMTPRLLEVRRRGGLLPKGSKSVHKIVAAPIELSTSPCVDPKKVDFQSAVFLGVLGENQGVQEMIRAIPGIIKTIPGFRFNIIGSGYFEGNLRGLVEKLGLSKHVDFKGFMASEEEVRKIIARSGVAVALYKPDKYSFTQFADSGKVKVYLSCQTPVVLTRVPYIAEEVEKYQAGLVINYERKELEEALIKILSDRKLNYHCRENALKLAKAYDVNKILGSALRVRDE